MKQAFINWKTTIAGGVILVAGVLVGIGKVTIPEISNFCEQMKTFIPLVSGFILAFFAHDPQTK